MAGNTPNPARRLESFTSNAIIWVEKIASLSPAKPLLDLGLGLMEVNPPGYVRDAYVKSLARQEVNQYGPSSGLPEFVQALAHFYSDLYKRTLNPNTEVSVHTGGSEALLCIIMAFIEHGDEVILIEPSFPLYELHIKFTGGTPVYVPLREPQRIAGHTDSNDWTLDLDEFKRAFTSKTKMVIVNTPHNPLGKIFSADELRAIGEICVDKGVVIVSDEVYEFANFELDPIPRTATISQAIGQHTLTVGSVGKAFNATGWRAGWVIGPESLIPLVKAAHIALCYVTPGPPQVAATAGFQEAEAQDFWRSNKLEMRGRLDVLCSILDEVGLRVSSLYGYASLLSDYG